VNRRDAPLAVFGAPGHRRILRLQRALRERGLRGAAVIDYAERMRAPPTPLALPSAGDGMPTMVKLDAPAPDADLHERLVQRGHRVLGRDGAPPADIDGHALAHRDLWFAGLADLLSAIAREAEAVAGPIRWLNPVEDILRMCDKWACRQALAAAGVDVPPALGRVDSHAHLRDLLDTHDCDRVFVKARYGSAAAGVVAYRRHRDGRELAWTTTELVGNGAQARLFNRLSPQRYNDRTRIAALIDALAAQECYAEAWIPKPRAAGFAGCCFDLRVIAFAGRPRQHMARIAAAPMTNLHLGNRRADPTSLLDDAARAQVEATVCAAARVFPGSTMIGFDVIPGRDRCIVLEANAFGDDVQHARCDGAEPADDQADWVLAGLVQASARETRAHG
jgi:glutathione synthase/RimK-type ligase-like ATP-grasp enzyme